MRPELFPIEEVARREYSVELQQGRRSACFVHGGDNPSALQWFPDSNTVLCRTNCGSINSVRLFAMARGMDVTTKSGYKRAGQEMMKAYDLQPMTAEEEQQTRRDDLLAECVDMWHRALTPELRQPLHARSISDEMIDNNQIGICLPGAVPEEKLIELGLMKKGETCPFYGKYILPGYLNGALMYIEAASPATQQHWNYYKPSAAIMQSHIIGDTGDGSVPVLVVEGYHDMLSAQQEGFPCVCTLGDPTIPIIKELKQHASRGATCIIAFDNDPAGREKAEALAHDLFPAAKIADVSLLGQHKDLNELLCSVGPERFKEIVAEIMEIAEDVMDRALKEFELLKETDERKAGKFVMESLIPLAVKLQPGEKEPVLKMLSERTKPIGIGIREIKKAVGAHEPCNDEEEEENVDIMETIPDIIDQPLAMIRDRVYAITRLWVNRKRDGNSEQEEMEFIITDRGEAVPKHKAHSILNVKVTLKELPLPSLLLSGKAVNAFMKGYRPEISYVFDRIISVFDRYIDFSLSFGNQEQMCKLSSCLALLTWFRLATEALPYPWPNGEKGSGKTQWGLVWSLCSFIGKAITSESSFAVFRDYAGYGASIMIDDAERVTDGKDRNLDAVRTLFLSGYRKGTSVDLKVKVGDDWISKVVDAYCPKAFTSIRVPDGAMGSRVIRIPLVRSINTEKTNYDPTNLRLWPCDWETLRDDSWLCALMHLPEASQINDDLNNETELSGRDYERWKGVFLIAKLLDRHGKSNIEAEMREIMWQYFKDDAGESSDDERIPLIIEEIEQRLNSSTDRDGKIDIPVKVIAAAVTEKAREAGILSTDKAYSPSSIGKILNRLRIGRTTHGKKGNSITVVEESLQQVKKVFLKNKLSSLIGNGELPSPTSQAHNHADTEDSALPSPSFTNLHPETCLHPDDQPNIASDDPSNVEEADNREIPEEFDLIHECPF